MRKVNVYTVTKFTKVDPTLYIEGSLFIEQGTDKVAVMASGKLKQINGTVPSLSGYVKKTEVEAMIDESGHVKKTEVEAMIDESEHVKKTEVEAMIDESEHVKKTEVAAMIAEAIEGMKPVE